MNEIFSSSRKLVCMGSGGKDLRQPFLQAYKESYKKKFVVDNKKKIIQIASQRLD